MKFRGRHRKTTFEGSGKQSAIFSRNSSVLHPLFLLFVRKAVLRSRPQIFAEFLLQKRWTAPASSTAFPLENPLILPVLNGPFSGKNRPFTNAIRNEVKFKMITGIKKKNKLTEIWFDEIGSAVNIRTYNTDLKNRLTAYAAKYPAHCRLTDDDECGCLTFEIDRRRFSVRLTPPYSEDRRSKAKETMTAINRRRQKNNFKKPL